MTDMQLPRKQPPILLVDDSGDDYEAVLRACKKAGITAAIYRAETAEEALEILRDPARETPGLVLLDLNMPGMGGRKGLQAIKEDEGLKAIPVVILTTSNYDEDVKLCYQAGANSYIQKPVAYDAFCKAIANLKAYWLETVLLPD